MTVPNTLLRWLQTFYAERCDGEWEHGEGISIHTIDNPGWSVKIPLRDTYLETRQFTRIEVEESETDWYHCWRDAAFFQGAGGPHNLESLLTVFRTWAETNE